MDVGQLIDWIEVLGPYLLSWISKKGKKKEGMTSRINDDYIVLGILRVFDYLTAMMDFKKLAEELEAVARKEHKSIKVSPEMAERAFWEVKREIYEAVLNHRLPTMLIEQISLKPAQKELLLKLQNTSLSLRVSLQDWTVEEVSRR